VAAQEPTTIESDPPAHVSVVDGAAVIERDGRTDDAPLNMPLLAGDRVRTDSGRVEILYADGSTLHLDQFTTVDFQSDELIRVLDGRVRLNVGGRPRAVVYRIDGPGAWAQISQPGEYRFALMRSDGGVEVELAVVRGSAELVNDDGRTPLRAGERALARVGAAPSYAYVFNTSSWDAFDRWSEQRRDYRLGLSAQYLPEEVRPYSRAFDSYGSWRHEPAYGYVWYPTVAVGWRPYYHGRWATYRPWGSFWIGSDPWAWPTHHYGRWGFSAGAWFWIPGRTWGPAWVSWAYTPGYVSWCPLGWNNRPVFSIVNINVYRGYNPWRGWTVIRRDHFGRDFVHRRIVHWDRLDARSRGRWELGSSAPQIVGHAVPRSQAPIRVVGRAVPRGSVGSAAPVYTNLPRDAARVQSPGRRIEVGPGRQGPSGVNRDPRARAVPRGDAGAPRMTPERGVRSAPAVRSGMPRDDDARPRAVQRNPAAGVGSAPAIRSDESGTPSYGRAPVPRQRSSGEPAGMPDRGGRAIPRGTPVDRSPGGAVEAPADRGPQRAPYSGGAIRRPDEGGWNGPRTQSERPAPERPAYGQPRAVPRATPRSPESRPAPSTTPPRMERRAPERSSGGAPPSRSAGPPPQRSAPPSRSAGGGGRGGAVRRPPR
jgi:hypothetical protein